MTTYDSLMTSIKNKPAAKSERARLTKDLRMETLKALATDKITEEEADKLLAANDADREAGRLTLKVSEKGCLSVYGLGRWPVSLYSEQWEKLLGMGEEIRAFMALNADRLKVKERDEAPATKTA